MVKASILPPLYPGVSWSSARPRVFVGSSSEGKPVAERLHALLTEFARPRLWPNAFGLGQSFLDEILRQANECEFGVFLMTADDIGLKRGETHAVMRDNVLFELGVFLGALGKDRSFYVYCDDDPPEFPSDLFGVSGATFRAAPISETSDSLRPVVVKVHDSIQRLMPISPLRRREADVRWIMNSAISGIARLIPNARSEDIGAHVWWLDSGPDARLTRVVRVRPGNSPRNNWTPWRRGEGVVGTAWQRDNTVGLDLTASNVQAIMCSDDFSGLPDDVRLGTSYEVFQVTRRDFCAVWATPIHDPEGRFLAVLSLNIDRTVTMPFSELNAIVRPAIRDLAATIGVLSTGA